MKYFLGLFAISLLALIVASPPAIAGAVDMGCSPTVANPCTGGSSGSGPSGTGQMGSAIGQAIGSMIGDAIRGNPEEDARRANEMARQQAEIVRQKAEEEAKRRRAHELELKRHEEIKNRLLTDMMDVDNGSEPGLGLMVDDLQVGESKRSGAFGSTEVKHTGITPPPTESGLQLLGDDEAKSSKQAGQRFDGPDIVPTEKLKKQNTPKDKLKKSE